MSGSRVQHLQRRSGIFHLRVRVPDDIRLLVGLTEVRRSLRTYQPARARTLGAVCSALVFEVFQMVRTNELSKAQVRGLICNLFGDISREIDRSAPRRLTDWELNEQLGCSVDVAAAVSAQRAAGAFDREVKLIAQRALSSTSLRWPDLAANSKYDLLDGAARLVSERERLYQLRLSDRLAPFTPLDPLFGSRPEIETVPVSIGPTLGEAIDAYLATKECTWTRKTQVIRARYLGYLRQHLGDDRPLVTITRQDVREFRDAVAKLRKNTGKAVRQSFAQKQTTSTDHQISNSTVALIFVPTKAFFRWCRSDQGYLDINPADDIRVAASKPVKGKPSRRPFSALELKQLFSAPVFTGCQSVKRRFVPGEDVIRDAYFWIPVLGLYTGARLGELVQLHIADIDSEDGIHFLRITEDGGHSGSPDTKHVKSAAGVRTIPMHPDLIDLGFLQFVERRRAQRKGTKRLWPEVKFGADGQASTVFSKWFGRLMSRAGLHDPALVFHSFRHNAEDAFRDALQPQYVIDRIIGHSDGATSATYGEGAALDVRAAAVSAMKLKISLVRLWAPDA